MHAPAIESLIEKFEQLPGIGRKSAERIAFHILENMSVEQVKKMSDDIMSAKERITFLSSDDFRHTPVKLCESASIKISSASCSHISNSVSDKFI